MSKILITGGAGFIGSSLLDKLLELGHECMILDNFSTGKHFNLPIDILTRDPIDISNRESVRMFFEYFEPGIVIHCAASYKNPNDWFEDARTNVVGTANICELSKRFGVMKLIYLQTSLCYGLDPKMWGISKFWPTKGVVIDDKFWPTKGVVIDDWRIKIDQSLNPAPNSYAITKTAAEQLISMSGIPFTSFRLANVYGPRNLTGAIPTFYKKLFNNEICYVSETRRDFIFIDDLVELIVRSVNGEGDKNYYHVSTGSDHSIFDLYRDIANFMAPIKLNRVLNRVLVPRNSDDALTILLDNSQTLKDFPGWIPKTKLEVGLEKTIQWYKENPPEEVFTHLKGGE